MWYLQSLPGENLHLIFTRWHPKLLDSRSQAIAGRATSPNSVRTFGKNLAKIDALVTVTAILSLRLIPVDISRDSCGHFH